MCFAGSTPQWSFKQTHTPMNIYIHIYLLFNGELGGRVVVHLLPLSCTYYFVLSSPGKRRLPPLGWNINHTGGLGQGIGQKAFRKIPPKATSDNDRNESIRYHLCFGPDKRVCRLNSFSKWIFDVGACTCFPGENNTNEYGRKKN